MKAAMPPTGNAMISAQQKNNKIDQFVTINISVYYSYIAMMFPWMFVIEPPRSPN